MKSVLLFFHFVVFIFVGMIILPSEARADGFSQLRWERRILLIHVNSQQIFESIQTTLNTQIEALNERRLSVFIVYSSELAVIPARSRLSYKDDIDTTQVIARIDNHFAILIGLDGGDKASYQSFSLSEVFKDIDGMPMRRAELRSRYNGEL